ncbi:hypothetical protein ABVT39_002311 [Epinephelus coioides]
MFKLHREFIKKEPTTSKACLLRSCTQCLHKQTRPTPQHECIDDEWQQWERVQDQTADGLYYNARLVTHNGMLAELIKLYEDKLKMSLQHWVFREQPGTSSPPHMRR